MSAGCSSCCCWQFFVVLVSQAVRQPRRQELSSSGLARQLPPDHSGPATAIVVNDTAYLVDLGPGVVQRANAAFLRGVQPLEPIRLRVAFITHLHSDHTLGIRTSFSLRGQSAGALRSRCTVPRA